jgi:hypothetical protein
LRNRIDTKPQLLVTAAAHAGGLAKLRAHHPSATGPWWIWVRRWRNAAPKR